MRAGASGLFASFTRLRRARLEQVPGEAEFLLAHAFDGECGHEVCAERVEVRVVFDASGVVRVLAGLELQEEFPRLVGAVADERLLALRIHVYERHPVTGRDLAYDPGVDAVRLLKAPLPVEASAHDGREQDGRRAAPA